MRRSISCPTTTSRCPRVWEILQTRPDPPRRPRRTRSSATCQPAAGPRARDGLTAAGHPHRHGQGDREVPQGGQAKKVQAAIQADQRARLRAIEGRPAGGHAPCSASTTSHRTCSSATPRVTAIELVRRASGHASAATGAPPVAARRRGGQGSGAEPRGSRRRFSMARGLANLPPATAQRHDACAEGAAEAAGRA